jgi:ATP-dependent DNA ligase
MGTASPGHFLKMSTNEEMAMKKSRTGFRLVLISLMCGTLLQARQSDVAIEKTVTALELEGLIGKRKDSRYEPGKRSGAWIKYESIAVRNWSSAAISPETTELDFIVVGYYRGRDLVYVARVRNGFVPASRRQLFAKLRPLEMPDCPFVNLPEKNRSRWGEGLTAEDMKKCVWLRPELVAQIEFLEWTEGDHLRHSKFAGLREDKDPRKVTREPGGES